MELVRVIGFLLALACAISGLESTGKAYMNYFAKEASQTHKQTFSLAKWNRKLLNSSR